MQRVSILRHGPRCALLSAAVLLAACTDVPDLGLGRPDGLTGPGVKQIESQIACEVRQAVFDNRPKFGDKAWAAVATLTLQVDDNAQLTPTLSFIDPLKISGTSFAFGLGGTASDARQRIFSETVTIAIDPILVEYAKAGAVRPDCKQDRFAFTGNFGIVEVTTAALDAVGDIAQPVTGVKNSNAFGETVQFVVVLGASGVGPTWSLTDIKGPGGFAGASETNTQKLVISFASAPKPSGLMADLLFGGGARPMLRLFDRGGSVPPPANEPETEMLQRLYGFTAADLAELRVEQENTATQQAIETAQDQNLGMLLQSLHTLP